MLVEGIATEERLVDIDGAKRRTWQLQADYKLRQNHKNAEEVIQKIATDATVEGTPAWNYLAEGGFSPNRRTEFELVLEFVRIKKAMVDVSLQRMAVRKASYDKQTSTPTKHQPHEEKTEG